MQATIARYSFLRSTQKLFIAEAAQTCIPKLTGVAQGFAVFRRQIKLLIFMANIRQGNHFFCVLVCLTSFRKVSHRQPVGCGMSIERLEGKTEVGSWWKESV